MMAGEQQEGGMVVRALADKLTLLARKRCITKGKEYGVRRHLLDGLIVPSDIPGEEAVLLPGDFDVVKKE